MAYREAQAVYRFWGGKSGVDSCEDKGVVSFC